MKIHKIFEIICVIAIFVTSGTVAYATFQNNDLKSIASSKIKVGMASWYSEKSPGVRKTTANMEIFDDTAMTCAMWETPFNQKLRVTNIENGKSVIVRVNDRGPHKRYVQKGRLIDLSKGAFIQIANPEEGLISVRVEFL